MKYIKITLLALLSASALSAQNVDIDYGSTFGPSPDFDALYFADSSGTVFNSNALMTVGYFGDIASQTDFSSYLGDFTQLGNETAFGAVNGYLSATAADVAGDLTSFTPYVMILGGITDFSNASTATSYSIFGDSNWGTLPAGSGPPNAVANLRVLAPDDIVVGSWAANGTSGTLSAVSTAAVPEPSAYALLGGLFALTCVMLRRRA